VLPQAFTGTFSSAQLKGGDTLTITSTTLLKFDTSKVAVTATGGGTAPIVSKTPDVIKVLVPFGAAGALRISGIDVTYVPGLRVTLSTSNTVTQAGDLWAPGDTGYATAPSWPLPTTTNQALVYLTQVPTVSNDPDCGEGTAGGGVGKCTIFKYTANGTDSLQFRASWVPATNAADVSDIDVYSCGSAGVSACFEGGGAGAAGATGKTPEVFTIKPSAGVHYFVVEQYSTGENPPSVIVTITKKN